MSDCSEGPVKDEDLLSDEEKGSFSNPSSDIEDDEMGHQTPLNLSVSLTANVAAAAAAVAAQEDRKRDAEDGVDGDIDRMEEDDEGRRHRRRHDDDDGDHDEDEGRDDEDNEKSADSAAAVAAAALHRDSLSHFLLGNHAAAAEAAAAAANASSIETLLLNVQGLLKVAADNARTWERQMNFEKAEIKMEVGRFCRSSDSK